VVWSAEHSAVFVLPARRRRKRRRLRAAALRYPARGRGSMILTLPGGSAVRARPRRIRRRAAGVVMGQRNTIPGGIAAVAVYEQDLLGHWRIFNTPEYRFYRSNVAPPLETDTPFATSASLPDTPPDTYADGTWYLAVSLFDGAIDSGFFPIGPNGEPYITVTIVDEKIVGTQAPNPPISWHLEQRGGDGDVWLIATYFKGNAPQADQFTYKWTSDGTTPSDPTYNPVDLNPTDEKYVGKTTITTEALAVLEKLLGTYADGKTITAKCATARQDVDGFSVAWLVSTFETKTLVVNTVGPTAPVAADAWPGRTPEQL
jgi:hypothetical protein